MGSVAARLSTRMSWSVAAPLLVAAALTRCGSGSSSGSPDASTGAPVDSGGVTQADAGSPDGSTQSGGSISVTCGVVASSYQFFQSSPNNGCGANCGPSTGSAYLPSPLPGPGSNCINAVTPECIGAFCPSGQICGGTSGDYRCIAVDAGCASGCASYQVCQGGACVNAACTPPPEGCPAQMPTDAGFFCPTAGPACPYTVGGQVTYCVECAGVFGAAVWDCKDASDFLPCLAPGATPPPVEAGVVDSGPPDVVAVDAGSDAGAVSCGTSCLLDQRCDAGRCVDNPCVAPPSGCPATFPGGGPDSGCDAGKDYTCAWPGSMAGTADVCWCLNNTHLTCFRNYSPVQWFCIPPGATALGYPDGGRDAGGD